MGEINIWMPLYWAVFWYDTQHLNDHEIVAYMRTMSTYWNTGGPLPDRVFRDKCGKWFPNVADFYKFRDGGWHHKRIDAELAKAKKLHKAAKERSEKGVAARRALGQI